MQPRVRENIQRLFKGGVRTPSVASGKEELRPLRPGVLIASELEPPASAWSIVQATM